MSLFDAFKRNIAERPDAPAFLETVGDDVRPFAWRAFGHAIECAAHVLRPYSAGAKVGILSENSIAWVCAHAACVFSGAVAVPLEMTLTPAEIAERLAFVDARLLFHSSSCAAKAAAVARLLPGLHAVDMGSEATKHLLDRAADRIAQEGGGLFSRPCRPADETAMILFTSGTTSAPRGAELTLRAMDTFADFVAGQIPLAPGLRSLMLLPLNHIYGLCATYMMLSRGVTLGVCPDFRRIFDDVARYRADFLCLVPALAEMLGSKIERRGPSAEAVFGHRIGWILSGGAPLSAHAQTRLEALGIKMLQIYGLTETCALYAITPYDRPKAGSAGLACGGQCGMETRVGADGSLMIRGPSVMRRYYRNPDRTSAAMDKDGWFNTGDIGHIDEEGYVWITGRRSRTIILSSGKKVAPEELEDRLLSLPGFREVVVSGDGASRELTAEVYADVSEETVRRQIDSLNRQLPVHKRLRKVVVRDEPFPRTASGKIRLQRVAAPVTTSAGTAVAAVLAKLTALSARTRRVASLLFAAALTALAVILLNLLPLLLKSFGVTLPPALQAAFEWIEESGEIILAFFALFAYVLARSLFRAHGESSPHHP